MVWIIAIVCVVISLGQFAIVVASARKVPVDGEPAPRQVKRWWRFAVPWVLIVFATDFFFDIDLLLLSGHMDKAELAIFGVCTRLYSLVSFGVAAVYAVTVPDIFEAEALADREGFNRRVGDANLVASGLSVALFLGTIVAGPIALMLFGPEFLAGAVPLAILCLALVVRSIFGPASMVLSINDRPYASLPSIALGMATLFVGNLVLVPIWGLTGAALAALIGITVWSLALWRTAYHAARIDVSIFPRLRALRAAQAASPSA
jgi:O-antigen/teichoic acid export membrane protein